ncbi:MAG: N-acetylmannosamine-6-phosphate 2-epimerase [Chloroflexi bacterium]|nr:N-acetylmannosamine-6-phosphate 2-epimerase [Chloroflexota bacterium]
MNYAVIDQLRGGLIVSCQAGEESALHGPVFMGAMAREAERGGASGLRIDGAPDIHAARQMTHLPIIGISKRHFAGYDPYITVTFDLAQEIVLSGADLVAMDGTGRPFPDNVTLEQLIARIHRELNVPVMADVSTLDEGIAAERAGADIVATTMSGYTPYSRPAIAHTPDFDLLRDLIATVHCPVIVEGRVTTPDQMATCFTLGAHAVCIGGAITNPASITGRFVEAIRK